MVKGNFVLFVMILSLGLASIPNLDNDEIVYVSPASTAFMQISSSQPSRFLWSILVPNSAKLVIKNPTGAVFSSTISTGESSSYQLFDFYCTALCSNGDTESLLLLYTDLHENQVILRKTVTVIVTTDPHIA
jgi:hypothetical protein